jgi:hypothetical protein
MDVDRANALAVNESVQAVFTRHGQALPGRFLFILEAMDWGLENGALFYVKDFVHWRLESRVRMLRMCKPSSVMKLMFNDGSDYSPAVMKSVAEELRNCSPEEVAQCLLDRLRSCGEGDGF